MAVQAYLPGTEETVIKYIILFSIFQSKMADLVLNYDGEEADFVNAEKAKKMLRLTGKERKG